MQSFTELVVIIKKIFVLLNYQISNKKIMRTQFYKYVILKPKPEKRILYTFALSFPTCDFRK